MAANMFGKWMLKSANLHVSGGTLSTTNLKALLCTSSYVPDFDAHEFRSSITGEVTGSGYTAGGIVLTGVTVSQDGSTNRIKITADNPNFGTVTISNATQIIFYENTGSSSTDRLISCHTFASAVSRTAANLTVAIDGSGIAYGTY